MRLWLDDVRPPPDGWKWARTNAEAKTWLQRGGATPVEECSLDHDLGLRTLDTPADDDPDYWDKVMDLVEEAKSEPEETGYDLVEWMIENNCVPPVVTIHSWNPDGAMRMARRLADNGYECVLAPFKP